MINSKKTKMIPSLKSCIETNFWLVLFGVLLLGFGIVAAVLNNWLIDIVLKTMVLTPGSQLEETWRKPPIEAVTNVYLFNWTNAEDIRNASIKPKFEQLGPYKFVQAIEKVNVTWNDNNNTVTYKQVSTWRCEDEYTKRSMSANVTTIDLIALSCAHKIRDWGYFAKTSAWALLSAAIDSDMHLTRTASELLFEGYEDAILESLKYFPFVVPEVPRFDRFGWFATKNGSADFDGVFNIETGADGNYELRNWNYHNETPYFGKPCGKVHGSAGDFYSPKRSKDYVGIFYSDICRYLLLEYEEDVIVNGILGYKYKVGDRILDNGTIYPENKCYCAGDCMPSGMINASSCRYGLPAFVSLPHFYGADPIYVDAIEGAKPEKEKHEGYLVLEPNTGIPLKAALRLQLNTLVQPVEYIHRYENVPTFFFPLIWLEHDIELSDHQAFSLKLFLNVPTILTAVSCISIIAGLCLLMVSVYKTWSFTLCETLCFNDQSIYLNSENVPLRHDGSNCDTKTVD